MSLLKFFQVEKPEVETVETMAIEEDFSTPKKTGVTNYISDKTAIYIDALERQYYCFLAEIQKLKNEKLALEETLAPLLVKAKWEKTLLANKKWLADGEAEYQLKHPQPEKVFAA